MKKLIISLFISVLLSGLYCDGVPADGSGSINDPYQITSLDNLLWLSTTDNVWGENNYFVQINDINAADTYNWNDGAGFSGIGFWNHYGEVYPFHGNYDGNSHVIDSLYICRPEGYAVSLFNYTSGAVIENLELSNLNVSGYWGQSGLIGRSESETNVDNCHTSGVIIGSVYSGGLVGYNSNSLISRCTSSCDVSGEESSGGLIGQCDNHAVMSDCYFTGSINCETCFGGISGVLYNAELIECYYNYESVFINGQHLITPGAITEELYNSWIENDLNLEISDHLDYDGENYLIHDFDDLEKVLAFSMYSDSRFRQTGDIDLSGHSDFYIPYIHTCYYGDEYEISGFNCDLEGSNALGFFGYAIYSEIESVKLTGAVVRGNEGIGGIIGVSFHSTISNCVITGEIHGEYYIGGLIGILRDSEIVNCCSSCDVNGSRMCGGLVGLCEEADVNECYSESNTTGWCELGGLVGFVYDSFVGNNYASGFVSGETIGGLVGYLVFSEIENCYSCCVVDCGNDEYSGGFAGCKEYSVINNCIWDIEISGLVIGVGYGAENNLFGLTSSEMQEITSYTDIGWDFVEESINGDEDIWSINSDINNGYPYLHDLGTSLACGKIHEVNLNFDIYPNPFNPMTNIIFEIGKSSYVNISVYNIKGQRIETIEDEFHKSGKHSLIWNAEDYSSGIYLINYQTCEGVFTRKITLLK